MKRAEKPNPVLQECDDVVAQCRILFARAILDGDEVGALIIGKRWHETVAEKQALLTPKK